MRATGGAGDGRDWRDEEKQVTPEEALQGHLPDAPFPLPEPPIRDPNWTQAQRVGERGGAARPLWGVRGQACER